jgi:hypothetical protein
MLPRQEGKREQEKIADQETVDRLAHHDRIFADIDKQQQHQLAGEQHRGSGRGDYAERQGDVDDAGQIGFEEVHHAERAEKRTDADAVTGAKQGGEYGEVDQRVGDEQQRVNGSVGGNNGGHGSRNLGHSGNTPTSGLESAALLYLCTMTRLMEPKIGGVDCGQASPSTGRVEARSCGFLLVITSSSLGRKGRDQKRRADG